MLFFSYLRKISIVSFIYNRGAHPLEQLVLNEGADQFTIDLLMTILCARATEGNSTTIFVFDWLKEWMTSRKPPMCFNGKTGTTAS